MDLAPAGILPLSDVFRLVMAFNSSLGAIALVFCECAEPIHSQAVLVLHFDVVAHSSWLARRLDAMAIEKM